MAMTNGGGGADPKRSRRSSDRRKRRPVSVVGVLGELLITAGVFVLLFLGWQVWLNDIIEGAAQDKQAQQLSQPAVVAVELPDTSMVGEIARKHGLFTRDAIAERRQIREVLGEARKLLDGMK